MLNTNYIRQTLRLLYWYWFKPLSLHQEMNDLTGGELLEKSLLTLFLQKKQRLRFLQQKELLRMLAQILLGNLLLLIVLLLTSKLSGLTALLDGGGVILGGGGGVVGGMAVGVTGSVAGSVVFGVALGAAAVVTGGVAAGIGGAVGGVALGVMGGLGGGVAFSMAGGVAASALVGVVGGVIGWVMFGVAGGVAYIASFLRLHLTPFWLIWNSTQWFVSQQNLDYANRAFATNAIQLDELIYTPLPLFGRLLVRCMEANPMEAREMLTMTAQSPGQKWAVGYAAPHWVGQRDRSLTHLPALATSAKISASAANILADLPRQEKLSNLLHDFAAVAHSLANIEEAHSAAVARQILDRNRDDLQELKTRAVLLRKPELGVVADHWIELILDYALELEHIPHDRLAGAYQAGSALETGTQLFQGRADLFAITNEVYADPQRAETLLLVAQQRMGKSSALMQLPVQIPDAHVVVVDCQRLLTGSGDDMFAAGLSTAIVGWERRHPGGIRQQPLDIDDLDRQPLYKLDRWLESYASKARRKRILLCLDEFDKLVHYVTQERLSPDVLALLRGLSQAKGWMILYSGQYELDDWIMPYAEYIKNVRRVRISYLEEAEARHLLEDPIPNFALQWEPSATDATIAMTGRQPFLLQMVGTQVVNRLSASEQRVVTAADIEAIHPQIFDSGRYYFQSLENAFDRATNQALHEIACTGQTDAAAKITERLVDYEYIEAIGDQWQFKVPLLREWWAKWTGDHR